MSDPARPDRAALAELDRLVRSLGEELAFFRRRALEAERRVRELAPSADGTDGAPTFEEMHKRVADLERENTALRERLDEAAARTRQLADRVKFIRQQQEGDGVR